jgi:glycosyltransferase involved in cell wall biosynthesis
MRIAVLTSLYPTHVRPREGIFAERRWLLMRARGHEVSVTQPLPWAPLPIGPASWTELSRTSSRELRSGIEVERPRYLHIPRCPRANARRFARAGVRALLARSRPDVVVADYAWPASAAAERLVAAGIPCVVNGRGSDVLQVAGEAGLGSELRAHLLAAGYWCAVSEDLVARMDELAGSRSGVLVPNGVDSELFCIRERAACRAELAIAATDPLVLVVGHLIERKDPLLALAVFAELQKSLPKARIAFVGRGPLEGELEVAARERGLAERVQLVGEADPQRLALWYGAANVLLLTSRREGRPNVVLEALASGLPVVATEAGGTAELLRGVDGSLSASRAPADIAALVLSELRSPRERESLRSHGKAFGWERGLDALEALLERAIEGAR